MIPALQQHPRFADALGRLGQRSEVVVLPRGEVVVVRRRVPGLGEIGYVPRGPAWVTDDLDARVDALLALRRAGVRLVEAETPCPSLRRAGFAAVATPASVAEIDLRADAAARRAGMDAKWRGPLRAAERSGLRVEDRPWDGRPHWLLDREAAQRRARRYRALPQAVPRAYAATPGAARILSAHEGADAVAGILVLLHPPAATYHIGWTGERGRRLSAHHLLLAAAADRLAAEGYARLDLGTVDTDGNPGLARFKIGAGARVRALGGSWVAVPGWPRSLAPLRARR